MAAACADETTIVDVRGIEVDVRVSGKGRDILFLNSGFWLSDETSFSTRIAAHGRVVAPVHPGFGRTDAPRALTNVDDLAYLYLDLIDAMGLEQVMLIGASFGGWIAAEMAVKTDRKLSGLILIDPLGVKVGAREERAIVDIFSKPDAELETLCYAQPEHFHREIKDLDDAELASRVRSREALARFGWSPYMHDPKLPARLHRINVPSLVLFGSADRMVDEACCRAYAEHMARAQFQMIPGAGHLPHVERPDMVVDHLCTMLGENPASAKPASQGVR